MVKASVGLLAFIQPQTLRFVFLFVFLTPITSVSLTQPLATCPQSSFRLTGLHSSETTISTFSSVFMFIFCSTFMFLIFYKEFNYLQNKVIQNLQDVLT